MCSYCQLVSLRYIQNLQDVLSWTEFKTKPFSLPTLSHCFVHWTTHWTGFFSSKCFYLSRCIYPYPYIPVFIIYLSIFINVSTYICTYISLYLYIKPYQTLYKIWNEFKQYFSHIYISTSTVILQPSLPPLPLVCLLFHFNRFYQDFDCIFPHIIRPQIWVASSFVLI